MEFVEPFYLFDSKRHSTRHLQMETASSATNDASAFLYATEAVEAALASEIPIGQEIYRASTEESVMEAAQAVEAKTTAATTMATSAVAASLLTTSGILATLMNGFISSTSHPSVQPSNSTDSTPDFVLKRLWQSFVSAVAEQTSETDIRDPKVNTFVSYLISPFALLCICMAILLNRTVVFATTRRPAPLTLPHRIVLRSIAIYFLASRTFPLISAIACTTSPIAQYVPAFFVAETCPTPAILWDLYWGICVAHFIETFSCVIQGQTPHSETGLTLFEYSLAFQEVQSGSRLSVEVLIVAITSAFSLLSLHIFGAFSMYSYRLIPSTIIGSSFLTYFGWSVFNGRIFYFPTVCIIGYLPQLLVAVIILMCGAIYGLTSLLSGGVGNLNTTWKHAHISLEDDFYTCVFKFGVVALTTATTATFIDETALIKQPTFTWLESSDSEEKEMEPSSGPSYSIPSLAPSLLHASQADVRAATHTSGLKNMSPYNNETVLPPDLGGPRKHKRRGGIGSPGLLTLFRVTAALKMARAMAIVLLQVVLKVLWNGGLKYMWPRRKATLSEEAMMLSGHGHGENMEQMSYEGLEKVKNQIIYSSIEEEEEEKNSAGYQKLLWGQLIPDIDNSADYADETEDGFSSDEEGLEYESDYEDGGSSSGRSVNYVTHVSNQRGSFSNAPSKTAAAVGGEKPKSTLDELYSLLMPTPSDFLALLSPQNPQEIERKRMLISHLEEDQDNSSGSGDRLNFSNASSYLFSSNSNSNSNSNTNTNNNNNEQKQKQKQKQKQNSSTTTTAAAMVSTRKRPVTRSQFKQRNWNDSKSLLHIIESRRRKYVVDNEIRETLCVVCQCAARQVILWPCRCLCVCEECRMALVAQNFKGCVCCRRDVKSFSRIYVP